MLPANTTSSPHLLSLWQISGLAAGSRAGEKEKEPCLLDSGSSPAHTPPGVPCFSHSALQEGNTWGPAHFLRLYHAGIHLHPLEMNPHPFPSPSLGGARCPGRVVVHRWTHIPGRLQEVLPGALAAFLCHLSLPAGLPVAGHNSHHSPAGLFPDTSSYTFRSLWGLQMHCTPGNPAAKLAKSLQKFRV